MKRRFMPGRTYSLFLVREFLKVFAICVVFLMGLSFIVRTLQDLDDVKEEGVRVVAVNRLLEAPEIISRETLLAACMFASVFTVNMRARNREMLALRSCGVSKYRIITPLILVGVGVCLFALAFEDFVVVPSIAFRRKYAARVRGENMSSFLTDRYNLIVFGEDSVIYKIGRYSAGNREMHTVMVLDKDDAGNVAFRIDAEGASWGGESWVFRDGVIRRFGDDGSILEERSFSLLPSGLADPPQYFARDVRKVTNMTILEGYRYIQVRRRMGFGYRRELTEYHRRIAGSVALFFVVLIGLSLGSLSFKNTFVISFSLTLVSVLVFYFVVEVGYVFGKNGRIPPAVGGWMGNIVFSTVGAFLVTRIRK